MQMVIIIYHSTTVLIPKKKKNYFCWCMWCDKVGHLNHSNFH